MLPDPTMWPIRFHCDFPGRHGTKTVGQSTRTSFGTLHSIPAHLFRHHRLSPKPSNLVGRWGHESGLLQATTTAKAASVNCLSQPQMWSQPSVRSRWLDR